MTSVPNSSAAGAEGKLIEILKLFKEQQKEQQRYSCQVSIESSSCGFGGRNLCDTNNFDGEVLLRSDSWKELEISGLDKDMPLMVRIQ